MLLQPLVPLSTLVLGFFPFCLVSLVLIHLWAVGNLPGPTLATVACFCPNSLEHSLSPLFWDMGPLSCLAPVRSAAGTLRGLCFSLVGHFRPGPVKAGSGCSEQDLCSLLASRLPSSCLLTWRLTGLGPSMSTVASKVMPEGQLFSWYVSVNTVKDLSLCLSRFQVPVVTEP